MQPVAAISCHLLPILPDMPIAPRCGMGTRAVKKPIKETGTARIRFIMLEAEMSDGAPPPPQITNAMQNALRSASGTGPKVQKTSVQIVGPSDPVDDDNDVIDAPADEDDEAPKAAPSKAAPARLRRPAKRKVVEIQLDSEVSLTSYVAKYPPKNDQDTYLVAVAFLCEHRKELDGVTADHVYTCFRKMNWPAGAKDFAQPLRNLKVNQLLEQGPGKGTYATNHIGLDKVHKLAEG